MRRRRRHLPTAIVRLSLAIAWRWDWVGAILFAAHGVAYIVMACGRFEALTYLLIAGSLFLMAALFLASWLARSQLRSTT